MTAIIPENNARYATTYPETSMKNKSVSNSNTISEKNTSNGMQAHMEALSIPSDENALSYEVRRNIESALIAASRSDIEKITSYLEDYAQAAHDDPISKSVRQELPSINDNPYSKVQIGKLVDLLFSLILLMGKKETVSRQVSGKLGEVSVQQAISSGENMKMGSYVSFVGSALTTGISAAITVKSLSLSQKSTNNQISSLRNNSGSATSLQNDGAAIHNGVQRQGNTAANVQGNSTGITNAEEAIIQQDMPRSDAIIDAKNLAHQEEMAKCKELDVKANSFASIVQPFSSLTNSLAQMGATIYNAQAKQDDASGNVASTSQNSEIDAAKRSQDIMARMLALIDQLSSGNAATANLISGNIRV